MKSIELTTRQSVPGTAVALSMLSVPVFSQKNNCNSTKSYAQRKASLQSLLILMPLEG